MFYMLSQHLHDHTQGSKKGKCLLVGPLKQNQAKRNALVGAWYFVIIYFFIDTYCKCSWSVHPRPGSAAFVQGPME